MQGGRFYSPSLKVVERAEFIFLIFHTFVCKFGVVEAAAQEKKGPYQGFQRHLGG